MSYNSKYTGEQVEELLDQIANGDIGGGTSGNVAYAKVDHGISDTVFALTPNTFHVWDTVSSLTLTLGTETSGVASEYLFQFTSGGTATTLSLPSDIKWSGEDPIIEPNTIYQISILNKLGSILSWTNISTIENKATINVSGMDAVVSFQYPVASDLVINTGLVETTINEGESEVALQFEPGLAIKSITPQSDHKYYYSF